MAGEQRENKEIILTFIFVLSLMAVLDNGLVVFLVLSSKRLRTFVNGFLVSLATSDMIINICVALFVLFGWEEQHSKTARTCYKYFLSSASMSEFANLCAVTYERYLAIVKPILYRTRIKKYFSVVVLVVWLSSFLVGGFVFSDYLMITPAEKKLIVVPISVIFVFIPLFFIILCYCYIFASLAKQKQTIHSIASAVQRHVVHQQKKREAKLVQMFAVVASLYILSTIPGILHESVEEIRAFTLPGCTTSFAHLLSFIGVVLSSLANPFIYTFTKRDFMHQITFICQNITVKCVKKKVQPDNASVEMKKFEK